MSKKDARAIIAAGDAPPLTVEDIVGRARVLQKQGGAINETIAEIGGPGLQRQARAVANVPGPGQGIADRTFQSRTETLTPRLLEEATRATSEVPRAIDRAVRSKAADARRAVIAEMAQTKPVGWRPNKSDNRAINAELEMRGQSLAQLRNESQPPPPRDFYEAREALQRARSGQGRAAYREAYSEKINQDIVRVQVEPLMRNGSPEAIASAARQLDTELLRVRSAIADQQLRGPNANEEEINRLVAELDDIQIAGAQLRAIASGKDVEGVNVRALDYYQRGLRQLSEAAGPRTPEGSAFSQARETFNSLVDQVAPRFGEARRQYGESMRVEEMMEAGRKVFNMPEGELDQLLRGPRGQGLSADELDGFMIGALDAIQSKINAGDTAFVARFMKNKNWQAQLDRALGAKNAQRLRSRIGREAGMRRFENDVKGGSRTTPLAEDIKSLTTGEDELSFIAEIIQGGGNIRNPVLRRFAAAYDRFNRPGIYNRNVNEALSKWLYERATPKNLRQLELELQALEARSSLNLPDGLSGAAGVFGARIMPDEEKKLLVERGAPQ
jgi:hypothetical protein